MFYKFLGFAYEDYNILYLSIQTERKCSVKWMRKVNSGFLLSMGTGLFSMSCILMILVAAILPETNVKFLVGESIMALIGLAIVTGGMVRPRPGERSRRAGR